MTPSSFHVSQTAAYVLLHAPICNTDGVFIVNKFHVRDPCRFNLLIKKQKESDTMGHFLMQYSGSSICPYNYWNTSCKGKWRCLIAAT